MPYVLNSQPGRVTLEIKGTKLRRRSDCLGTSARCADSATRSSSISSRERRQPLRRSADAWSWTYWIHPGRRPPVERGSALVTPRHRSRQRPSVIRRCQVRVLCRPPPPCKPERQQPSLLRRNRISPRPSRRLHRHRPRFRFRRRNSLRLRRYSATSSSSASRLHLDPTLASMQGQSRSPSCRCRPARLVPCCPSRRRLGPRRFVGAVMRSSSSTRDNPSTSGRFRATLFWAPQPSSCSGSNPRDAAARARPCAKLGTRSRGLERSARRKYEPVPARDEASGWGGRVWPCRSLSGCRGSRPESGTALLVGTVRPGASPGAAMPLSRRTPSFHILPAWLGMVVETLSDRVELSTRADGFALRVPGPLLASEMTASLTLADAAALTRTFDFPDLPTAALERRWRRRLLLPLPPRRAGVSLLASRPHRR